MKNTAFFFGSILPLLMPSAGFAAESDWQDDICGYINRSETICRQTSQTAAEGKSRIVLTQTDFERPIVAIFYNASKVNAMGGRIVVQAVDRRRLSANSAFSGLANSIRIELIRDQPELGATVKILGESFPFTVTLYNGLPLTHQ